MGTDYVKLKEAQRISGMHPDTLKRLLRSGEIRGFKATDDGRHRWFVSLRSLNQYREASTAFMSTLPPRRFYLKPRERPETDEPR